MSKHLPDDAKLVFKGNLFEVFQWNQKMFDDSFQTFEHLKRQDTVIIFPVTEDKKIIIQEEEQPHKPLFLTFTAGKVEEGESPEIAAQRELLEETGYEAKELIPWFSSNPVSKIDWTIHVFIGKNCKKVAEQNLESGEKIKLLYLTFDEFLELVSREDFPNDKIKIKVLEANLDSSKLKSLKKLLFD